jgi:PAS domain-containing protein
MFEMQDAAARNALAHAAAIGESQAVIEFEMDGTIVTANRSFLNALGYSLPEIQGRHHGMFVEPSERDSAAYGEFWAKQAPDEIGHEIGNLNSIADDVVEALGSIKQAIQDVSANVTTTVAAVGEQSAEANEMSSGMQRAAAEAASIGR